MIVSFFLILDCGKQALTFVVGELKKLGVCTMNNAVLIPQQLRGGICGAYTTLKRHTCDKDGGIQEVDEGSGMKEVG